MSDEALLAKCLEFARCLSETVRFSFQMNTSTGFKFNFSNQASGKPEDVLKKNKKTPSQMKRNKDRLKTFLEKKRKETSGKPDVSSNEVKYILKMEAHAACTTKDIVKL